MRNLAMDIPTPMKLRSSRSLGSENFGPDVEVTSNDTDLLTSSALALASRSRHRIVERKRPLFRKSSSRNEFQDLSSNLHSRSPQAKKNKKEIMDSWDEVNYENENRMRQA